MDPKEKAIFDILKSWNGNLTLGTLQRLYHGAFTHDEIVKGIWLWLQHNKQE